MRKSVEDMVVVITGASTGIGRATALRFARHGATLVLTARREDALRNVATQCEKLGTRALVAPADVTDEAAVRAVAQKAIESFGRIDVWINNAAVTLFGRLEEAPYPAYRRVIETNLFGYIHGARAVLPYFREQGEGVLLNVASVVGKISSPYISAYVASKYGILGLTESLRMELRDAPGIRVCAILPGSVDTPLFQHGANYMGRAPKPLEPVDSAERVADAIVAAALKPDREMVIGKTPRTMIGLHALAPRLFGRLYGSQVERKHFQDRPAAPSDGNLFSPMHEYDSVSGGWLVQPPRPRRSKMGFAAVAALGVAIAFFSNRARLRRQPLTG